MQFLRALSHHSLGEACDSVDSYEQAPFLACILSEQFPTILSALLVSRAFSLQVRDP